MAKLPMYTQQYRAGSPTATADSFGAIEGQAKESFGNTLTKVGASLFAQAEKKKMLSARKAVLELEREYATTQQERRDRAENLEDFDRESLQHWDDLASGIAEKYGFDGAARQWFDEQVLQGGTSVYKSEGIYAAGQQAKILTQEAQDIINMEANKVTDNPETYDQVYANIDGFVDLLPGADNKATRMKYRNMVAENLTVAKNTSLLSQAKTIDEVDAFIKDFKEEGRNKQDLTPAAYAKFLKAAETKRKTLSNQQKVTLQFYHQDGLVRAQQTGESDGRTLEMYIGVCDPSDANCIQKNSRQFQEYELAVETGKYLQMLPNMTPGQITAMQAEELADLSDEGKAAYLESQQYKALSKAVEAHKSALLKDPAQYLMTYNDTVREAYEAYVKGGDFQDYASATMAAQMNAGLNNYQVRLYTEAQVDQLVGNFDIANQSANEIRETLSKTKQDAGAYWPQVYREIASELPDEVLAIADAKNEQAAKTLAELSRQDVKELEPDSTVRNSFTSNIMSESENAAKVYRQSTEGSGLYQKKVNAATKLALFYRRSMSDGDATSAAVDDVFGGFVYGDTFGVETTNPYAERVVRKSSDFLSNFSDIKDMPPMYIPEGMTQESLMRVISSRGQLVNSPTSDELYISFPISSDSGSMEFLRAPDGSQLGFSYEFIANETVDTYKRRRRNR